MGYKFCMNVLGLFHCRDLQIKLPLLCINFQDSWYNFDVIFYRFWIYLILFKNYLLKIMVAKE